MLSHLRDVCGKSVRTLRSQKGQGLVEYALILVLIAIVVIVSVRGIGSRANSAFSSVNSSMAPVAQ